MLTNIFAGKLLVEWIERFAAVLVHPLRNGRDDLVREYRDILLRSPGLTSLPLGEEIAEQAARLRAGHSEDWRRDLVFDQ